MFSLPIDTNDFCEDNKKYQQHPQEYGMQNDCTRRVNHISQLSLSKLGLVRINWLYKFWLPKESNKDLNLGNAGYCSDLPNTKKKCKSKKYKMHSNKKGIINMNSN